MSTATTVPYETLRLAVNGVTYNVTLAGTGPPLLLLHGFTGSAATWTPHLHALAGRFLTIGVDLLGHGQSDAPADPKRYRMDRTVDDLLAMLDQLATSRAAHLHRTDEGRPGLRVLGYSMGGRVALHLALAAPERIAALVLESASPGIANQAERTARMATDQELAGAIGRDGITAFVDRWESLPLFASQQRLPDEVRAQLRAQRLANSPVGLANSLRGMGAGAQEPLYDRLPDLSMPVLLIAGALDEKYRVLAQTMAANIPRARAAIVPGAGHAVHLEQPTAFEELVLNFLP
jgi:2-succinyl-6-hydroxy-2,4-cyclohexadiene-1-carboxylate synthase